MDAPVELGDVVVVKPSGEDGPRMPLASDSEISMGRDESCDIRIRLKEVSRHQLTLVAEGTAVWLVNKSSTNPTSVDGVLVTSPVPLPHGACFSVAGRAFRFDYRPEYRDAARGGKLRGESKPKASRTGADEVTLVLSPRKMRMPVPGSTGSRTSEAPLADRSAASNVMQSVAASPVAKPLMAAIIAASPGVAVPVEALPTPVRKSLQALRQEQRRSLSAQKAARLSPSMGSTVVNTLMNAKTAPIRVLPMASAGKVEEPMPTPVANALKARRVSFGVNSVHRVPHRDEAELKYMPSPDPLPMRTLASPVCVAGPPNPVLDAPAPRGALPTPVRQQIRNKSVLADVAARRAPSPLPEAAVRLVAAMDGEDMAPAQLTPANAVQLEAGSGVVPHARGLPTPVRQEIRARKVHSELRKRRRSDAALPQDAGVQELDAVEDMGVLVSTEEAAPSASVMSEDGGLTRTSLPTPVRQQIRQLQVLAEVTARRRTSTAATLAFAPAPRECSPTAAAAADASVPRGLPTPVREAIEARKVATPTPETAPAPLEAVAAAVPSVPSAAGGVRAKALPTPVRQDIRKRAAMADIAARRIATPGTPSVETSAHVNVSESASESVSEHAALVEDTLTVQRKGLPTPVRQQIRATKVMRAVAARRTATPEPDLAPVAAHETVTAATAAQAVVAARVPRPFAPEPGSVATRRTRTHMRFQSGGGVSIAITAVDTTPASNQGDTSAAPAHGAPHLPSALAADIRGRQTFASPPAAAAGSKRALPDVAWEDVAETVDAVEEEYADECVYMQDEAECTDTPAMDDISLGIVVGKHMFFTSPEGERTPAPLEHTNAGAAKWDWVYDVDAAAETDTEDGRANAPASVKKARRSTGTAPTPVAAAADAARTPDAPAPAPSARRSSANKSLGAPEQSEGVLGVADASASPTKENVLEEGAALPSPIVVSGGRRSRGSSRHRVSDVSMSAATSELQPLDAPPTEEKVPEEVLPTPWDEEPDVRYHRGQQSILYAPSEGRLSTLYEDGSDEEDERNMSLMTAMGTPTPVKPAANAVHRSRRRQTVTPQKALELDVARPPPPLQEADPVSSTPGAEPSAAPSMSKEPATSARTRGRKSSIKPIVEDVHVESAAAPAPASARRNRRGSTTTPSAVLPPEPASIAAPALVVASVPTVTPANPDACGVCGLHASRKANPMMLCDGCDGGFHMKCVALARVPAGEWFCVACDSARRQPTAAPAPAPAPQMEAGAAALRGKRGARGAAGVATMRVEPVVVNEPAAPVTLAPSIAAAPTGTLLPGLTAAIVNGMKVVELRAACSERGLDAKGVKAELVVRLLAHGIPSEHVADAEAAATSVEEAAAPPPAVRARSRRAAPAAAAVDTEVDQPAAPALATRGSNSRGRRADPVAEPPVEPKRATRRGAARS